MLPIQPPQPTSSHASTLANTVYIERLSDDEDEDVDITDDLSDDGEAEEVPADVRDQPSHRSLSPPNPQPVAALPCSEEPVVTELVERDKETVSLFSESPQAGAEMCSEQGNDEHEGQSSRDESSAQTTGQVGETCCDSAGKTRYV